MPKTSKPPLPAPTGERSAADSTATPFVSSAPTPSSWVASRDAAIADFLDRFADCPDRDVLADLMVAITRLARDGAEIGRATCRERV